MADSGTIQVEPHYHFDIDEKAAWFRRNGHWSLVAGAIYMAFIYYGQIFMRKREAFTLKSHLVVWNAGLAIFSAMGSFYVVPEFLNTLLGKGFVASYCDLGGQYSGDAGYWGYLYILTKLPELMDTVFLVLRKRKVIFLHSYHHASVLAISWYVYPMKAPFLRWGISMNLMIHTIMYTYYGLRAAGFRPYRGIAMSITVMQIVQMLIATCITVKLFVQRMVNGHLDGCEHEPAAINISLAMYVSYLALFVAFFVDAYCRPPRKSVEKSA